MEQRQNAFEKMNAIQSWKGRPHITQASIAVERAPCIDAFNNRTIHICNRASQHYTINTLSLNAYKVARRRKKQDIDALAIIVLFAWADRFLFCLWSDHTDDQKSAY